MQGLLLVESVVGALVYGLLVAFAASDDLSRPDPVRESVAARRQAQDGGGHGDAPGPLEQGDLAAQQPGEPDQPLR